jgi:hypothetical protein
VQGRGLYCSRVMRRAIHVQDRGLYTCKGVGYTRAKTEGNTRARQRAIHMQDRG